MRVALYVRVSTKEQVDGYSIDEQLDRLKAYAKSRDYTVVKPYVDGGYSGASLDRPAMKELINNIDKYEAVLVYNLKRLSRSQKDTLYMIEDVFIKNNVEFVSLSESLDTSSAFGRAMIGVLSAFAQLDREQIKEQLELGRVARAKDGYYHGGDPRNAPIGYDYIDGELVVNEFEADCVRYIFSEYVKGVGYYKIFEDIQVKFKGVTDDPSTVNKILSRELYIGKVLFSGETYEGRHTPIIDNETFETVQRIRGKRRTRFASNTTYVLSGLLHCGHCGARMAGHAGKKLKNGNQLRYYTCYTRRGSPKHMMTKDSCDKKFEPKHNLEDNIIKQISKVTLADVKRDNSNKNTNTVSNLESDVNKIDKQVSNLVDLFALGNIPVQTINNKIDDLNSEKEAINNRIKELIEKKGDTSKLEKIIPTLKNISEWGEEEQQMTIIKMIESITVYNDRVVISWVF